jgi:uncharacterized protein Yka (UPF0111/DUF47 family)
MGSLMFNLLPKDAKFYDELEQLSSLIVSATQNLNQFVDDFPRAVGQLELIERSRLAARKVFEESLLRLDQAFITPIDREDILTLSTQMFKVVNRVAELSQRFRLYNVQKLYPTLTSQAKNLSSIAQELDETIRGLRKEQKLRDMKPRFDTISATMELVRRDREYFLGTLFCQGCEPLEVMKQKELHDLLEDAIERCERASETMARVMLKNA